MKPVYEMIEKLENEIRKYAEKPELTPVEWEAVYKAADGLKDFETFAAMHYQREEYDMPDGMSGAMRRRYYPMSGGRYNDYPMYGRNTEMYDSYRDGNHGMGDNRSRSGDFYNELERLMRMAPTERERESIRDLMQSTNRY